MHKTIWSVSIILLGWASGSLWAASPVRVLCWSEVTEPKDVYPQGIHGAIAEYLNKQKGITAKTAKIDDPDFGVPENVLAQTDVLFWYGHRKHAAVPDEVVQRIVRHVKERGMGFIAIHSSHFSKPFKALVNDVGSWSSYVDFGQPEEIWVVLPGHPVAKGLRDFTIPRTEIYTEPFKVPQPEAVILEGTWKSGHRSREVLLWTVGKGRVAYLRFGHEGYPIFFMPPVQQLMQNLTQWTGGRTKAPREVKKREAGPAPTVNGPYKKS